MTRIVPLNLYLKKWATQSYRTALRNGLVKPADRCEYCGSTEVLDGHHFDYSQPLNVIWLCSSCHQLVHWGYNQQAIQEYQKLGMSFESWWSRLEPSERVRRAEKAITVLEANIAQAEQWYAEWRLKESTKDRVAAGQQKQF